jgi:hypothetical protein
MCTHRSLLNPVAWRELTRIRLSKILFALLMKVYPVEPDPGDSPDIVAQRRPHFKELLHPLNGIYTNM